MKRLDELFEVRNGLASGQVEVSSEQDDTYSLMYVCPSKTQAGAIAGWLNPDAIPLEHIYPAGTLHVSGDGAGSHTYSYVSTTRFVPTHHVRALIPRQPMAEKVLRFYAYMITANRPKFSYGRAPRGERLAKIMLLERHELPEWLEDVDLSTIERAVGEFAHIGASGPLPEVAWAHVKLTELFDIRNGVGPTLQEARRSPGDVPYITRSAANNGVAAWVDQEPTHPAGCITVATDANAGEAFYQRDAFCAYSAVAVFQPKQDISELAGLFLATVIQFEGTSRYGYSRAWSIDRMKTSSIWVPVTDEGTLNLEYIEEVIKASKFAPVTYRPYQP